MRLGSSALRQALDAGWLVQVALENPDDTVALERVVDRGEADAILLAEERGSRFLLLDDRRGRLVARERGLVVVGTGGVLGDTCHCAKNEDPRELLRKLAIGFRTNA